MTDFGMTLDDGFEGQEQYLDRDIEDASGAPESAILAEHKLVGILLLHHNLVADARALVSPDLFFDRPVGRLFEFLVDAGNLQPDTDELLEALGPASIIDQHGKDLQGKAAVGYLRGLGVLTPMQQLGELADLIFEVGERRLTAKASDEVNLAGTAFEFNSRMGLLMWEDRNTHVPDTYDYLVEDTIPERELAIIMGATQAGKSFLAFHLAMCMVRAVPFFGRRILEPVPVIWLAYEGGRGARGRMLAYQKHFGLEQSSDLLFAALTRPFDLWSKDTNVEEVIKECEGIIRTKFAGRRPGAVFVDTHNAATPGASEIDSEAVSKIRDRYKLIMSALGCAVIIIGHTNALGKHRGNELLVNNVDTVITVTKKSVIRNRIAVEVKDDDRRIIRAVELVKQREGETGHVLDFVLPAIETGVTNKFGKSRTSCVVTAPNWSEQAAAAANAAEERETAAKRNGLRIRSGDALAALAALMEALAEHGEPAPPAIAKKNGGLPVVQWSRVSDEFKRAAVPEAGRDPIKPETLRKRWKRGTDTLKDLGVLFYQEPFMWWTGKEVQGVKETMRQQSMPLDDIPPATEFPED